MLSRHPFIRLVAAGALALTLSGCDTVSGWFSSEEPKLPGERISILALESKLEPEQRVQDLEVILPAPFINAEWPQSAGTANAAMQHVALGPSLQRAWSADIGAGADGQEQIVSRALVAGGRVYTMDSEAKITAFNARTGERIWRVGLARRGEDLGEVGGGMAIGEGRLIIATAYGDIYAMELATGRYYWRGKVDGPVRGAPTISNGRIFLLASENRLFALNIEDGAELWQHQGIIEAAELIGAPAPSAQGPFVLAPYSSGELYTLRADTGQALWSDQLVRARRITPLGSINDLDGQPIIDDGKVYAISHGGYLAAYDLRQGNRLWDQDMAGSETPWIAGGFLFIVTNEAELVALSTLDGGIRWVTQMPKFTDVEDKRGRITWVGPVLAGDRLIVAGSNGAVWSMSPYDGSALGSIKFSDSISVAPIVAGETLYIVTDGGDLVAYR